MSGYPLNEPSQAERARICGQALKGKRTTLAEKIHAQEEADEQSAIRNEGIYSDLLTELDLAERKACVPATNSKCLGIGLRFGFT